MIALFPIFLCSWSRGGFASLRLQNFLNLRTLTLNSTPNQTSIKREHTTGLSRRRFINGVLCRLLLLHLSFLLLCLFDLLLCLALACIFVFYVTIYATHACNHTEYESKYIPCVIQGIPQEDGWCVDKWNFEDGLLRFKDRLFKCGEDDDGYSVKIKIKYFLQVT